MIYRAEHTLLGRLAAVKILHPELCTNRDIVNRFFNEAKTTTSIKHPGIVEVFDFGYMPSGHAYLIMELLEGMPLSTRIRARGLLAEGEAAMLLRSICIPLAAAHDKGIVHRDLKPDNIFVVPDPDSALGERAKILDFGIAKLTDIGLAGTATKTGAVMGTPTYMSPEQCRGTGDVDYRADLYSIGCMFYELVTGRPPFVHTGAGELIGAHLFVQPEPPARHAPGLTPQADALIMRLLAKQPEHRVQTAKELIQHLTAIAQQHGWRVHSDPSMPVMGPAAPLAAAPPPASFSAQHTPPNFGAPTPASLGAPTPASLGAPTPASLGAPTPAHLGPHHTPANLGAPTPAHLGSLHTPANLGAPTPAQLGPHTPADLGAPTPATPGTARSNRATHPTPANLGPHPPLPFAAGPVSLVPTTLSGVASQVTEPPHTRRRTGIAVVAGLAAASTVIGAIIGLGGLDGSQSSTTSPTDGNARPSAIGAPASTSPSTAASPAAPSTTPSPPSSATSAPTPASNAPPSSNAPAAPNAESPNAPAASNAPATSNAPSPNAASASASAAPNAAPDHAPASDAPDTAKTPPAKAEATASSPSDTPSAAATPSPSGAPPPSSAAHKPPAANGAHPPATAAPATSPKPAPKPAKKPTKPEHKDLLEQDI